jgi:serine/threonine protein kinase
MSASPTSTPFLGEDSSATKAQRIGSLFEDGWRPEQSLEDIEPHLPSSDDPLRPAVLRELTVRDLNLRLIHGLPARAEDYLTRFPELWLDRQAVRELLRTEFDQRHVTEPDLDLQEYQDRFPEWASELAGLLCRLPVVPGYEVLEKIGHGGSGVVYKARQTNLKRLVALKLLPGGALSDPHQRKRFHVETEAVARLQHPNVVQVYNGGDHEGLRYLVLEYCPGGTLADHLNGTPWPSEPAARLVETLAHAVQHAHEHGIIHRDLKPANVLMSVEWRVASGEKKTGSSSLATRHLPLATPKIADFGLAKLLDEPGLTSSGQLVGTPGYLAPEQADRIWGPIGPAADVYALGAILYELLAGRPPFAGAEQWDTLRQVLTEEPIAPRRLHPQVDRRLETVCLKCLRKEPGKRYASAADLADDLRRFREGQPVNARPVGLVERGWRWCRRQPLAASLAALLVLVVLGAVGTLAYRLRQEAMLAQKEKDIRKKAEERLALAKELLIDLARISNQPLTPKFDELRGHQREVLLKVEANCRRLLEDPETGPEVHVVLAEVYGGLSGFYAFFQDRVQGRRAATAAVGQWEALARTEPGNPAYLRGLALARCRLAGFYEWDENYPAALALLRPARAEMKDYVQHTGQESIHDLIEITGELANCLTRIGGNLEAQPLLIEARDNLTQLLLDNPMDLSLKFQLANVCAQLANSQTYDKQTDQALRSWFRGRELFEELVAAGYQNARLKGKLADCCARLAQLQPDRLHYAEAVKWYEATARDLLREREIDPSNGAILEMLGNLNFDLAQCHQRAGQDPLALEACKESVRWWEMAIRLFPAESGPPRYLARSLALLSMLQTRLGSGGEGDATVQRLAEVIDHLEVIDHFQSVVHKDPYLRAAAGRSLQSLSQEFRESGRRTNTLRAESLQAAERSLNLFQELVEEAPDEVWFQAGLSNAWTLIGKCHWQFENHDQVLFACQQSLRIARQVFEKAPDVPEYRAFLDQRHNYLERILGEMRRLDEVLTSLLEREKLWPGNAARLGEVAAKLHALADEVADVGPLSPPEQQQQDRYRAEAERVARKADEAALTQSKKPGS